MTALVRLARRRDLDRAARRSAARAAIVMPASGSLPHARYAKASSSGPMTRPAARCTLHSVSWLPPSLASPGPEKVAVDGSIDSYLRWLVACQNVRRAYRRWLTCDTRQRRLAFDRYLAALEEHAASMHSYWTERLHALAG